MFLKQTLKSLRKPVFGVGKAMKILKKSYAEEEIGKAEFDEKKSRTRKLNAN